MCLPGEASVWTLVQMASPGLSALEVTLRICRAEGDSGSPSSHCEPGAVTGVLLCTCRRKVSRSSLGRARTQSSGSQRPRTRPDLVGAGSGEQRNRTFTARLMRGVPAQNQAAYGMVSGPSTSPEESQGSSGSGQGFRGGEPTAEGQDSDERTTLAESR